MIFIKETAVKLKFVNHSLQKATVALSLTLSGLAMAQAPAAPPA